MPKSRKVLHSEISKKKVRKPTSYKKRSKNDGNNGESVLYNISVNFVWGNPKINAKFPPKAHSGNMWLIKHTKEYNLFEEGQLASEGIAETSMFGTVNRFQLEARENDAIRGAYKGGVVQVPTIYKFPNSIELNKDHRISFSSMIAPSPDWFVGVNSVSPYSNGKWLNRLKVPMWAYDAGTDYGSGFYNEPDFPELKPKPIKTITGPPLFMYTPPIPIAYLIFNRVKKSPYF